jgi:hypothetical protein
MAKFKRLSASVGKSRKLVRSRKTGLIDIKATKALAKKPLKKKAVTPKVFGKNRKKK